MPEPFINAPLKGAGQREKEIERENSCQGNEFINTQKHAYRVVPPTFNGAADVATQIGMQAIQRYNPANMAAIRNSLTWPPLTDSAHSKARRRQEVLVRFLQQSGVRRQQQQQQRRHRGVGTHELLLRGVASGERSGGPQPGQSTATEVLGALQPVRFS